MCYNGKWLLRNEDFPAYAGVFPISNRCAPFPFPAYAGVFQAEAAEKTVVAFPRVCGGVAENRARVQELRVFSPRMRGCF